MTVTNNGDSTGQAAQRYQEWIQQQLQQAQTLNQQIALLRQQIEQAQGNVTAAQAALEQLLDQQADLQSQITAIEHEAHPSKDDLAKLQQLPSPLV